MEKHPQSFDVCIVCALPEEARAFLEVAQQQCEDTLEERMSPRYHYSYRFATVKNNKGESLNLHISWLPRYGPQETTLHLSRVLEECQPRIAIMTGICAGDAQHVQLGDLVVAERTFTYDNGKFTLDEHGRSVHLHDTMTYQLDANILQFLGLFDDWQTHVARLHRPPSPPEQRKVVCHLKPMASGSAVRVDRPFEGVQAPVRGTVAIDMEGAAFGLVMSRHPLIRWLVVKGVCDYADKTKNDAYHEYAARVSALYALSFIRAYVTNERLPGLDGPSSTNRAGSPGIWNVPYAHNPFFTGREQELDQLHTQLQQRNAAAIGQTQAISGLGGIGKTQLAVEYACRYRDTYDFVLWARAESVEALNTSYIELAQLLNLPEKEEPEQAIIVQAVKTWLRTHQGYLLILDNADKPDMLVPFLPPAADGHLLLTTRSSVMRRLNIASPLILETLTPEQGALFLLYRAGSLAPGTPLTRALPENQVLAQQISQDLGGLPLAIEQAAAYIEATVTSLSAYRSLYQKHRIELLKREQPLRYPHTVATTWDISFQHVEATNHAAAELLRFCAFLAPDAIPEEILTLGAEELGPILAPVAADTFLLNDTIAALHAYSLLTRNSQAQTLTIHRLVQAVVGDNLPDETKKEWMQRAILAVNIAFPNNVEFTQWTACKRYAPHALFCATWIAQNQFTMPEAAHLLHQTGMYFAKSGRYTEAEPLLQHALTINELQLGAEHLDTITCLNNLASLYVDQGKYVEAEPLYQRVLVIREQQLEADPSHTAASLNNLAMLYIHQGRYTETERLLRRALDIWEQQRDAEHLNIATCLSNLGGVYVRQGKFAEAESLLQRALVINERHMGLNHPNTASTLRRKQLHD
jgi:nucleoside phosphorylase/Tfp pilus assembly protein PilF